MNQHRILIRIADIVFDLSSDSLTGRIPLEDAYTDFLCDEEPEVTIRAHYNGVPQLPLHEENKVFDSEMLWSLYRRDGRNVFLLKSPLFGPLPYRAAIFDGSFRKGDVYSRDLSPPMPSDDSLFNPLSYPLSELLMVCLLAQGRGLMVHACGILDRGKGYLFAGNSTHGKTTMARIWKDRSIVLNDDRIVLRQHNGRFWMYGTPWHGDYNAVSPEGVPVEKIFFLRHAESNTIERKKGGIASAMVLTRCFPPLWDAEGMRFTLDFCSQLVDVIPCYELGFLPSEDVIELVRSVERPHA